MDDWGVDVAVVLPSAGLFLLQGIPGDPELSTGVIKGYNLMAKETCSMARR